MTLDSVKEPDTASARDAQQAPLVSIIIVSYNVKEYLQECITSIRKALAGIAAEIFVVDNASDDGSAALIKERFPGVQLIANTENLGFARANNLALTRAQGRFIVLINPDTVTQEDTFSTLLRFMDENPDAGMVGCKVLNPDGTLQHACRRSYPTPWVALTRLTGLSFLFPKSRLFGRYNLTYLPEDKISSVEAISGSFMMLRRRAFEQIGLLDEDFFLYGEDLDWCYRTIQSGWKIYYVPTTKIIHFKGESSKQSRFDTLRVFYQSMALFVKKHFRKRYFFITYYFLLVAIWVRAAVSFLRNSLAFLAVPLVDFLLLQLSLALALWVKFGHLQHWGSYLPVNAIYSTAWLLSLAFLGSYGRRKFSFFKAAIGVLAGFVFNSAFTFFFKQYAFSRAVLLLAGGFNLLFIAGWRLLFKLLNRFRLTPFRGTLGHTLLARRSVVVGDFSKGEQVVEKLKTRIGDGYELIGLVSLNIADVGQRFNGLQVLGSTENLAEIIRRRNIQEVIFSTHRIPYDRILDIISGSRAQRVSFKLIPSNLEVIIGKASIDQIHDVPLLDIDYKLSRTGNRALKRAFDASLAVLALVLGLPFFLIAAVRHKHRVVQKNIEIAPDQVQQVRVLEFPDAGLVGKLLWLWPVLHGQLSLVGRELADRSKSAAYRQLKPGLTGIVQVNRDRGLTRAEKQKYEIFYLTQYSVLLDLEIVFKAVFKI